MSLSEETRLELLKMALEGMLNHSSTEELLSCDQIAGFHDFLLDRMKVAGESKEPGRDKGVADDADPELDEEDFPRFWGEMTGYQLSAIERGFIPDFIKKTIAQLATEEIKRRRAS